MPPKAIFISGNISFPRKAFVPEELQAPRAQSSSFRGTSPRVRLISLREILGPWVHLKVLEELLWSRAQLLCSRETSWPLGLINNFRRNFRAKGPAPGNILYLVFNKIILKEIRLIYLKFYSNLKLTFDPKYWSSERTSLPFFALGKPSQSVRLGF